jgi:hypothetical protein
LPLGHFFGGFFPIHNSIRLLGWKISSKIQSGTNFYIQNQISHWDKLVFLKPKADVFHWSSRSF